MDTSEFELSRFEFVNPVVDILKEQECLVSHYSQLEKSDVEKADRIIICGTALKDNKFIEDIDMFDWIRDFEKPILGICAGFEIIALIFGSKLEKGKELGVIDVDFESNKLFESLRLQRVYALHQNTVDMPKNFLTIAKSSEYLQGIKHKNKKIYGLGFHPEVLNQEIIRNFSNI